MSNILPPEFTQTSAPRAPTMPRSLDPLERIAGSLDRLVALQTDARVPVRGGEAVVEWLSRIDHADLDHVVMTRQKLGTPVMHVVLEVLKEWAADARS